MELVVIGTTEFLPGFALAGARNTVIANAKNIMEKIKEHHEAGLIILDEQLTKELSAIQREELETSIKPVIITLAKDGEQQASRLRRTVMNTLGVDLLK
jgi:V/A-type H+/Na+-transporting ATPase subunit F